jgi:chemotaxis protein CheD
MSRREPTAARAQPETRTWTENVRAVPLGQMMVSAAPGDVLVAYGLGSCVAVCLYDPRARVGGMLHALLPAPLAHRRDGSRPAKFVALGVPLLVAALRPLGARPAGLRAYLCGGARMLSPSTFADEFNIGVRNIAMAERALREAEIPLVARATGGNEGRTAKLYIGTGRVLVRTLRHGERVLAPGVEDPWPKS